ncbi:MAG: acyltransferase family protein [Marinoscillum sp.]
MERRHDIDWLRIIAILLVLYFHTAMLFTAHSDWHIQNAERSDLWGEFNFWLSRFRMPLLFFVSGYGTFLALRKRSAWTYIKERHNRLLIPLVFSMLVIVPPQIYFERIFNGATFSYFEFYPTTFSGKAYPEGNLSWHHMWFVCYLFIYSVVGLPIFLWLKSDKGSLLLDRFIQKSKNFHGVLLMLPTILLGGLWTYWNESYNNLIGDLPWHPYWFSFFFMGFITGKSPGIWNAIANHRRLYLGLSLLSILIVNYVRWNDINFSGLNEISPIFGYTYLFLLGANTWFWLLSALGYGKQYLNKPSKILPYANRAIYPFYILHQTIIIIIGYYVIQTEESILAKYIFVSTLSLVGSLAIYEFLIRPFRPMRFLFGVKEEREALKSVQTELITKSKAA